MPSPRPRTKSPRRTMSGGNKSSPQGSSRERPPSLARQTTSPGQIAHVNYHRMNDQIWAYLFLGAFMMAIVAGLRQPYFTAQRKYAPAINGGQIPAHLCFALDGTGGVLDTATWSDVQKAVGGFSKRHRKRCLARRHECQDGCKSSRSSKWRCCCSRVVVFSGSKRACVLQCPRHLPPALYSISCRSSAHAHFSVWLRPRPQGPR